VGKRAAGAGRGRWPESEPPARLPAALARRNGLEFAEIESKNSVHCCVFLGARRSEGAKLLSIDYPGVIDLRFSPRGDRLALAEGRGKGNAVLVVGAPAGKKVTRYSDLHGVRDIFFRSDEELFIAHGAECRLCDLRRNRHKVIHRGDMKEQSGPLYFGKLSPDGNTLALGANQALLLLDVARNRHPASLSTPTAGYVCAAAFSPDGRYLAFATSPSDYTYISFILVWDRRQEKAVRLLKLDSESVDALAFRPDNRLLAVVMGHGGSISFYGLETESRQREYLDETCPAGAISDVSRFLRER